jgi:hypothetical protein
VLIHVLEAVTIASPRMSDSFPGAEIDHVNKANYMKDLYLKVDPEGAVV